MRKAWFGYTASSHEDKPSPCIWYDDLPVEKNYLNPTIVGTPVKLGDNLPRNADDELAVGFYELQLRYPPPEYVKLKKFNLNELNQTITEVQLLTAEGLAQ